MREMDSHVPAITETPAEKQGYLGILPALR